MNTPLIKKFLPRFLFVGVLTITLAPLLAYAADFVPLAPIPNLDTSENATIGSYVNSVFLLVISVAAMLAVIRIVIGGFQYMTQTASVTKTASAINTIRDAVIGLLLLLGSFVILSTVNSQILGLDALNFTKLGPSQAVQDAIKDEENLRKGSKVFLEPLAADAYARSCTQEGGTLNLGTTLVCQFKGTKRYQPISDPKSCTGKKGYLVSCTPKGS